MRNSLQEVPGQVLRVIALTTSHIFILIKISIIIECIHIHIILQFKISQAIAIFKSFITLNF